MGLICVFVVFMVGCGGSSPPPIKYSELKENLISFKKEQFEVEKRIIQGFIEREGGEWKFNGKIFYRYVKRGKKRVSGSSNHHILYYSIYLLDGAVCDSVYSKTPYRWEMGRSAEPPALDLIFEVANPGDCLLAVIPSHYGYGVPGKPPCIPPNTPILYKICIIE